MATPPVYVSSGAFPVASLESVVHAAIAAEVPGLELSSGLDPVDDVRPALRDLERAGVPVLLHNYFPPPRQPFVLNLASADPDVLQRTRDHCVRAIELTAEAGASYYSVHAGFCIDLPVSALGKPARQLAGGTDVEAAREAGLATFTRSVHMLADVARGRGVELLVENNVVTAAHVAAGRESLFLLIESEEILGFFSRIDDDAVGLLLDTGHLNVSARALGRDPVAELEALAPIAGALHLSENDGASDQNLPVREDSWFLPALRSWRGEALVIEAYALEPPLLQRQIRLVQRCVSSETANNVRRSTGV